MIAVDAKNYTLSRGEFSLPYEKEFQRALTLERIFRLPVWYAYKGKEIDVWYWISALKAMEVGKMRTHGETREQFLVIRLEHFVQISSSAYFAKLHAQRCAGVDKLRHDANV